jgi:demethylmenaquinone methyltransferase/2-methoxy-6-polyprenyl-1,4-benzoquinol methylase
MRDNENIIRTFTEMAPNYEETVNLELQRFWGWSYQEFIRTLLRLTPIEENIDILDLATGTGKIPRMLKVNGENGYRIHGLDITHSMLIKANRLNQKDKNYKNIKFTCASAMEMPYVEKSYDLVFCGLATHHMDVELLLNEVHRILRVGGKLAFADVGSSNFWKIPGVKWVLRLFAFIYYLFKENPSRAWAEAGAISNVRSRQEWHSLLHKFGFNNISIVKLETKNFWIPGALIIHAEKSLGGKQ